MTALLGRAGDKVGFMISILVCDRVNEYIHEWNIDAIPVE